jgi:hypothetical protein
MALLLMAGLATNPPFPANAQLPPSTSVNARVAANPLLADVQRMMPAQLPLVLRKLSGLAAGPANGSRAGDTRPTAAEAAQIAQNPEFEEAFRRDPADTLALLRFIDGKIK